MRYIFTCFFLLPVIFSFSQDYNFKTHDGSIGSDEEFYSVAQIADGSFITVGYTTVNDPTHNIFIINTDKAGQQIWTKTILTESVDTGFSAASTTDGGFAICGNLSNKMAILKFDASGDLQWTKQYAELTGGVAKKLLQTSDGGYMIAGGISSDGAFNNAQSYLIKTDASGTVAWAKKYFTSSAYSMIRDLKPTNDGNYIFAALNSAANDTTCIVKINSSGDVLWADYFGDAANRTVVSAILPTNDGGYVIAGNRYKTRSNGFALKLNAGGARVWSKTTDVINAAINFHSLITGNDGGYAIVGSGSTKDSNFYYALNIQPTGELAWSKTNRKADNDYYSSIYSVINSKDGGYAATGSVLDNSGFLDGMLQKLDFNFATCRPDIGSFGTLIDYGTLTVAQPLVASGNPVVSGDDVTVSSTSLHNRVCYVLPLTLISLNATLEKTSVKLQWQTAQEINTSYFGVEKSNNAKAFSEFKQVPAAGNSSYISDYYAFDDEPFSGKTWYRLKMVDKDGLYTYSGIVAVSTSNKNAVSINPNPVGSMLNLNIQSVSASNAVIQIADLNGKLLLQASRTIAQGFNVIPFNVSRFAKGIYIIKIVQVNNTQSLKWVKE